MDDYISDDKDLKSLSFAVENYAEDSTHRTDKIIDTFCSKIDKFSAHNDFGGHFDEVIDAIIEDINASGEMEEFLTYMSGKDKNSIYDKLKDKYFSTDPHGTYTVFSPGIDDSAISDKPDQVLDPRMSDIAYNKILTTLHHIGLNMEQHPQSFIKLGETDIRNHILSSLKASMPENAASAETLNAAGKTDIILKHLNSNLFVAECKIWKGPSTIKSDIDQLLSYLTWRDSKSALIVFVKTLNFSSILSQIKEIVGNHPNHTRFVSIENQNRFNFEFTLPQDSKKIIKLAVVCFNFYQKKKTKPK